MRSKSIVLLALALGCGLVASIGISQVMERRNNSGTPGETEAIIVALNDINSNETLTAANVKIEEWPKSKVPQGAITKVEDYEGKRARQKIYLGEPIIAAKLIDTDAIHQASIGIPKGYRVVAVRVDAVSGGGSLILPDDRVDVLVFLNKNPSHGILETQTKTILQDVKVFAVDTAFQRNPDQDEPTIAAKTISLLVTPEQAEKVTLATELGAIRLVLRNGDDNQVSDAGGADSADILGIGSGANRAAEKRKAVASSQISTAASGMASATKNLLDFIREHQQTKATVAKQDDAPWKMMVLKGSAIEVAEINSEGLSTVVGPTGNAQPQAPAQAEPQQAAPEEPPPTEEPTTTPTTDDTETKPAPAGPRISLTR